MPSDVTATGVSGVATGRDQSLGDRSQRAHGGQQHERRAVAVRATSRSWSRRRSRRGPRARPSRSAGFPRTRARPTRSARRARPRTARRRGRTPIASSGPVAYVNGSPTKRRTTRLPALAGVITSLVRWASASGWPSSPKPPSTTSTPGRYDSASWRWAGTSATTTSAAFEQVAAADGQQPGVTRTGTDEGHAAERPLLLACAGCGHRISLVVSPCSVGISWRRVAQLSSLSYPVLRSRSVIAGCLLRLVATCREGRRGRPRRASSSSAATRRPRPWGSPTGPDADHRIDAVPSRSTAIARSDSSRPSSPSTSSASAPIGALHPAWSTASTVRSAATAARACGVLERGERGGELVGAARPEPSTASAPCAGAGSITIGSNVSVIVVQPTEPGQPRPRQDDRVDLTVGDLAQPRVDVAADADDVEAEPEQPQLGRPPRRSGADRGTGREVAERAPVARHQHVARVLPRWHRDDREPGGWAGRQVLVRVHGDVDPAVEQGVAQRADEHARCRRSPAAARGCGRRTW